MRLQQLIQPLSEAIPDLPPVSTTGENRLWRSMSLLDSVRSAEQNRFRTKTSDGNADMGRGRAFISFSRVPNGQYVSKQKSLMTVTWEIDADKLTSLLNKYYTKDLSPQQKSQLKLKQTVPHWWKPWVYGSDDESRKYYKGEKETRLLFPKNIKFVHNMNRFVRAVHIYVPSDIVQRAENPVDVDPDIDQRLVHNLPTPLEISQKKEQDILRLNRALDKLEIRTHMYLDHNDFLLARVHKSFRLAPQSDVSLTSRVKRFLDVLANPRRTLKARSRDLGKAAGKAARQLFKS